MTLQPDTGLTTSLIHKGYDADAEHGAIIPPLHLSTTFKFGNDRGYEYSRSGNPTRDVLEATLVAMDEAKYALAYSSGSAVLANVGALLKPGEAILFSSDAYGGTYRYVTQVLKPQGIELSKADFTDLAQVEKALIAGNVAVVWAETPTNPLLKVVDIEALANLAHRHGALLIIDNTFATPVIQRPLSLGADAVVYSTTKYIGGHSDTVGGSIALRDSALYDRLKFLQNTTGTMLSPFDSWLTLRGLRTLELRMKQHTANARAIVEVLSESNEVEQLYYPELFRGEQGDIVNRQMALPGGMVSVEFRPEFDTKTFLQALQYFPLAESLGGVESLINHPASMTHASIPKEERQKIGLSDGLLRISVGIENTQDLVKDVRQAIDKAR